MSTATFQEGYSISLVCGNLPECTADQMLRLIPAVQAVPPSLINEGIQGSAGQGRAGAASSSIGVENRGAPSRPLPGGMSAAAATDEEQELRAAMAMSLAGMK